MRWAKPIAVVVLETLLGCHAGNVGAPGGEGDLVAGSEMLDGVEPEALFDGTQVLEEATPGEDEKTTADGSFYVPDLGLYLCDSKVPCPFGWFCYDEYCVECLDDSHCPSKVCRPNKKCLPLTCSSDADCLPYFCLSGQCVECRSKEDCWPNEECVDNRCEISVPCAIDEDCPDGYRCFNMACVQWGCKPLGPFEDTCPENQFCDLKTHQCLPDVCPPGLGFCFDENSGWVCKPDGSGFLHWDQCPYGKKCIDGHCQEVELPPPICDPTCEGRECGVDGCGALCGVCKEGQACQDGRCVPVPRECFERDGPGCPDCPCEGLVCGQYPQCCQEKWDFWCARECDVRDPSISCPFCAIYLSGGCALRECGVEPCGSFCGGCEAGGTCVNGTCLPKMPLDMGRKCTLDAECTSGLCEPVGPKGELVCTAGCGEAFACPSGWSCIEGRCRVKPDCLGQCRACGFDQCGNPCGPCPQGKVCNISGFCVSPGNGCAATPGVPTCGGCPCQACVCSFMPSCCSVEWSDACALLCRWEQCDPLGLMKEACKKPPNPCAGLECGTVWLDGGLYDCGSCPAGWRCVDHHCVCEPRCEGRVCGPDGCGGYCGGTEGGLPPHPPLVGVFCEDGVWKFRPLACYAGHGPDCFPGPPGWQCMDMDCICDALPLCCEGVPLFWDQSCIEYAIAFCGLNCDAQPWPPQ